MYNNIRERVQTNVDKYIIMTSTETSMEYGTQIFKFTHVITMCIIFSTL